MTTTRPRVAVIYYSATGNVHRLAEAVAFGASRAGAAVRLRRVAEFANADVIAANRRWSEHLSAVETVEVAQLDDLDWADGIALGTPTRFGGPAAQLKAFTDSAGPLWAAGALHDKVLTAFTSASTQHGGLETTITATLNLAYHWGALVMPIGYGDDDIRTLGNPYGASWVSRHSQRPDAVAIGAARAQGRRLAEVSGRLAVAADYSGSSSGTGEDPRSAQPR